MLKSVTIGWAVLSAATWAAEIGYAVQGNKEAVNTLAEYPADFIPFGAAFLGLAWAAKWTHEFLKDRPQDSF